MSKKQAIRVVVSGKPRPNIDVDAVVQIVIGFGRELAARNGITAANVPQTEVVRP